MVHRYYFEPNSLGRDTIEVVDEQAQLRSLLKNGVLFNDATRYNDYGEPLPTARAESLDCCTRKPQRIQYKWMRAAGNPGEPGGMNRFDPEDLNWQVGTMGIPRVYARYESMADQRSYRGEAEHRHAINYYHR